MYCRNFTVFSSFFDVNKQRPTMNLKKCYQYSVNIEISLDLKVYFTLVACKINNLIELRSTNQIIEISAAWWLWKENWHIYFHVTTNLISTTKVNLWFSDVFRGYQKRSVPWNGLTTFWSWEVQEQKNKITVIYIFLKNVLTKELPDVLWVITLCSSRAVFK